jgi:16S rRNA (guanine966-N2)-methyltransferase
MRVISGVLKGRKIFSIDNVNTRPLTNQIQEALFNIIRDVEDVEILELFAGFGMFSWEALSRGAKHSTMVEKNSKITIKLRETAKAFQMEKKVSILTKDIFKGLGFPKHSFDLIFADPPFGLNLCQQTFNLVIKNHWLKEKGIFIIRHHYKEEINTPFEPVLEKKYGDSIVKFFKSATSSEDI